MNIIPAIADKVFSALRVGARLFFAPEPRIVLFRTVRFGASVLVFQVSGTVRKRPAPLFADITGEEEGADVLANAIVEVWVPALGLLFERLPADEDVERGFAFENRGQLALESSRSSQTFGGAGFVGFGVFRPVAESSRPDSCRSVFAEWRDRDGDS